MKNRPDDVSASGTNSSVDFSNTGKDVKALRFTIHSTLRQISFDYERYQYNTVVSGAMKLLNALEAFDPHIAVAKGTGDESILNFRRPTFIDAIGLLLL